MSLSMYTILVSTASRLILNPAILLTSWARCWALLWSSANLSMLCSRAYNPQAAKNPDWRIPPPNNLRHRLALAMKSFRPTSKLPTGAPNPLERQIETESKSRSILLTDVLVLIAALKILAPSMCIAHP